MYDIRRWIEKGDRLAGKTEKSIREMKRGFCKKDFNHYLKILQDPQYDDYVEFGGSEYEPYSKRITYVEYTHLHPQAKSKK